MNANDVNNALLQYTVSWILIGLVISIIMIIKKEWWDVRQENKYQRMNWLEDDNNRLNQANDRKKQEEHTKRLEQMDLRQCLIVNPKNH